MRKIKINLFTLAIDYKNIEKKLNLQLHHRNENLRPQVDMTHNNRYQNRSRTVGHKPDHPRKIIIRENTDMWKKQNIITISTIYFKELKPLKMEPCQRKPIWALFSQYFIVAAFWDKKLLTAVSFETGAMPVPTKSQNPTICGSGDPFHWYLTHS